MSRSKTARNGKVAKKQGLEHRKKSAPALGDGEAGSGSSKSSPQSSTLSGFGARPERTTVGFDVGIVNLVGSSKSASQSDSESDILS
jgi:hypothetical protein